MPKRYGDYKAVEGRVQEALEALESSPKTSLAVLARQFDVPYYRLYRRARGAQSKSSRPAPNIRLNATQDLALKAYIDRCDQLGMPALIPQLVGAAQRILDLEHPSGQAPALGKDWVARWLKANPDCRRKNQRQQELNRIASNTVEAYTSHFDALRKVLDKYVIQPQDLYNMDETGFRIGVGGNNWVVTRRIDAIQSPSDTNRDYITAIETISADGYVLPPFLILKAKIQLEKWYTNTSIPSSYTIGLSETGYNNDELSLEWLKHFDKWTRRRQAGLWRLLLFDGFGSHSTKEFLDYCDENQIVAYTLPPHTSHNLQPLDVAVFQSYKKAHRTAVEHATREGCTDFNKLEFLDVLYGIRKKAFTRSTIQSAWLQAGIEPWDPWRALIKVYPRDETRTPPYADPDSSPLTATPTTPRSLIKFANKTESLLYEEESCDLDRIERLAKAAVVNAHLLASATEELHNLTAAARERRNRQSSSRKQILKGGVLTAREARSAINRRAQQDAEKAIRQAARQAKTATKTMTTQQ